MSEARVAALVCEGQTDVPILRAIIQEVWPEIEDVRCLQPELDEMERAKRSGGWTQVKAWCEAHAGRLDEVLDPDLGDRIDLLLVAIDVDIAVEAGIADPPRHVGGYETNRLRKVIARWLATGSRSALPSAVQISTPVRSIEAWIVAAHFRNERSPETLVDAASYLVMKRKLRPSTTTRKPWKELHVYTAFAPVVAARLKRVRQVCAEADRTVRAIERRRDSLPRG